MIKKKIGEFWGRPIWAYKGVIQFKIKNCAVTTVYKIYAENVKVIDDIIIDVSWKTMRSVQLFCPSKSRVETDMTGILHN